MARKILSLVLSFGLLFQQVSFAQVALELNLANYLSKIGSNVVQDKFRPLHLRYFSYDSDTDNFKVLLDKGDAKKLEDAKAQEATKTLLSYFLVGITLPDDMFWVNLRPDSENQIIDQYLEKTDVGKIMLEADLQLKKDTALFTSPQTSEGREYWTKLYQKAEELYGYESVTIPTLTRPWIVPGEIIVREAKDSAYVYKASLKVMLEQDYLKDSSTYSFKDERSKALNEYSSQLIRELIIPKLTKEVNSSKRYAPLRQVYYSLILSRWFKLRFTGKSGTYASLINTKDLTNLISQESWSKTDYFKQYQKSFSEGEYNVKEPVYTPTGQVIRSYFSGGINVASSAIDTQNGIILANDNVNKLGNVIGGRAVVDPQSISLQPAVVSSPIKNSGEESAASPVDAMTKQVLAQPSQAFEIPVADLMKTYGSNIKWVIDRLKQSTAGTRGSIVIPSSASEDEGDIHGGPELNAAVVLLMAQAYSNYINKITLKDVRKGAFVGFDPRYFSKEFAQLITRVMMGNGLIVYRDTDLDTYTATPLTSYMAYLYRLASGIEITSSHNPPNQNGVKSSTYYGGVDTDDISAKIAMEMEILNNNGQGQGIIKVGVYDESKINFIDAKKEYYERYISRVFTPDLIAIMKQAMDGGAKFIFDGLFGVGGSTMEYYLNRLFGDYNWRGKIIIMNAQTDPRIGGIEYPDPSRPETLEYSGVLEKLANNPEVLISATADMDADRTGTAVIIPDEDVAKAKKYGLFVSKMDFKGENVNVVRFTPQQIFTLIGYDRAKQAIARGIPADKLYLLTSIPTSLIGKEMIKSLGGKAILTTVGFKNLGYEAQSLDNTDPAALPILLEEESGGAIISPFDRDSRSSTVHRDKDTCVLALALYTMASRLYTEKRNMLDLYIEMSDKLGGLFYSERIDAYVPNKVIAESKKQDDKASADSIKQTVIKKFRAIDNVEGNLDKSENIATLCRLFDKTPEDVSKITEYSMDEVSLLVGEGDSWEHIKPRAKRFMFKDGESIEVFHTGRVDQEGPSISIFDKGGKLKARALIRPSGTESMVRVYLEILEPMETPNPQNLYDYFKKLLEYLDLHEYGSKGDGLSYLEQHLMNIRKYETIDPFNLSEKDVLRWDKIQQQVALETIYNTIFPLIEKSYLSENEKRELKLIINKLREISLDQFERSKKDNPLHHSFIVLEIVLRIALGEKLQYQDIRKLATLAILHDLGYGAAEEGKGRISSSKIKKMIKDYEFQRGNLSLAEREEKEAEIKKTIQDAIDARKEHMEKGIPVAQRLLNELNNRLDQKVKFDIRDMNEICVLIGMHDNPGIAKTYETKEYKPYITGSAQELLIDKNNRLAVVFREADRLWMLSYDGLIKDLMDKINKNLDDGKGMPNKDDLSVEKQLDDNTRVFSDERNSYDAADGNYGKFYGDTFIRTETGFLIFQKFRTKWLVKIFDEQAQAYEKAINNESSSPIDDSDFVELKSMIGNTYFENIKRYAGGSWYRVLASLASLLKQHPEAKVYLAEFTQLAEVMRRSTGMALIVISSLFDKNLIHSHDDINKAIGAISKIGIAIKGKLPDGLSFDYYQSEIEVLNCVDNMIRNGYIENIKELSTLITLYELIIKNPQFALIKLRAESSDFQSFTPSIKRIETLFRSNYGDVNELYYTPKLNRLMKDGLIAPEEASILGQSIQRADDVLRKSLLAENEIENIFVHLKFGANKEEAYRNIFGLIPFYSDKGKASSPMKSIPEKAGGIDFRALPMVIQPMGSFNGLNFKLPQLSPEELERINVNSEIQQIKNMVQSGIAPSGQRIKELIAACIQKKEMNSQVDSLLLCLVDIFKLEEENTIESSPELREALVIVDSQS